MARQTLTVESIGRSGLEPTVNPAHADGHAFVNNGGKSIVRIINGNATDDVTLSVACQDSREGLDRETRDILVPATETRIIGGLTSDIFEIQSGADKGKVYIDFADGDVLTDVDLEAYQLA